MSARVSSRRLTALLLAGPVLALGNQVGTYATDVWACGHHAQAVINVVPAIALLATLVAGTLALGDLGRIRRVQTPLAQSPHFLAICAVAAATFSALVIIAQWAAVGVFPACMQS
jgi:hypothetical protein